MPTHPLSKPAIYSGKAQEKWRSRHRTLLAEIAEGKPDVLFVGDSLTGEWRSSGQAAWNTYIHPLNAFDIGIGGDTSAGLLYRLESPELNAISPKIVVLCIGTNSVGHNEIDDIFAGIMAVADAILHKWPHSRLLIQQLPLRGHDPSSTGRLDTDELNARLSRAQVPDRAKILPTAKLFDPNKSREFLADDIHLTSTAYEILGRYLSAVLKEELLHSPEQGGVASELIPERTFKFEHVKGSRRLVVSLNARESSPGYFMNYKNTQIFECSRLFLLSLHQDFYQRSYVEIFRYIDRLIDEFDLEDVRYVGMSAGAYAALILGMRGRKTSRIMAFQPQFVLDTPYSIADRTLEALTNGQRIDARFADIRDELHTTKVKIDITLGCYNVAEGAYIRDAQLIDNPSVRVHYLKCGHDTSGFLGQHGAFMDVLKAIADDIDFTIPHHLIGSPLEQRLSIESYGMFVELHKSNRDHIRIPEIDDRHSESLVWFNIKARCLHRNGQLVEAIAAASKTLVLPGGGREEDLVCLGNYLYDAGSLKLAFQLYLVASDMGIFSRGAVCGMANICADRGDIDGTIKYLEIAQIHGVEEAYRTRTMTRARHRAEFPMLAAQ